MPITYWKTNKFGEFDLYNTDESLFDLIRCREDWECHMCKNKIKNGSYCLGSKSIKICMKCSDGFLQNFINSLGEYKGKTIKIKQKIEENKDKYLKHNLVCSLK